MELLGGRPTPGIGFGLGLDRILLALREAGAAGPIDAPEPAPVAVVVGTEPADTVTRLRIATELRAAGLAARAELGHRKLGKQLEAAARDGAHFAVIVGDELGAGHRPAARPRSGHATRGRARGPRAGARTRDEVA